VAEIERDGRRIWGERALFVLVGAFVLWVFGRFLTYHHPFMGPDLQYFFPRLMDTHHFMSLNGPRVHWWTPSFGGGLPVFANPQSIQYSLPQLLVSVLTPTRALMLSYWIVTAMGFVGCHLLLRRVFEVRFVPALFGAAVFSLGGFALHHAAIGHLTYQAYPLLPLWLLLLLTGRPHDLPGALARGTAVGAMLAYVVYSGAYFVPFVWALSALMVLALLVMRRGGAFPARRLALGSGLALPVALLLAAPKLHAVLPFMGHFPRTISSEALPASTTWLGLLNFQLFGSSAAAIASAGRGDRALSQILDRQMDLEFGLWEYDCSLPLAIAPLLLCALLLAVRSLPGWRGWGRRDVVVRLLALVALGLAVWATRDLMMARGWLFPLLKRLPGLASLHVTIRFAAVFSLPFVVGAAVGMNGLWDRFRQPLVRGALVGVLALLCVPLLSAYRSVARTHYANNMCVDTQVHDDLWKRHRGDPDAIRRVAEVAERPQETLRAFYFFEYLSWFQGITTTQPYEPLFGYSGELYRTPLRPGPVERVWDGGFNMHHPPAFLGGAYADGRPFDRIPATDSDNFERFVSHGVPDWPLPPGQRVLLRLAQATALACLFTWLAVLTAAGRRRWRATPRTSPGRLGGGPAG